MRKSQRSETEDHKRPSRAADIFAPAQVLAKRSLILQRILPLVSKPSRYLGDEINSVRKNLNGVDLKFVLAFPDVYEIGMSYVGFQILYNILNRRDEIACERVYTPWWDMEKILRQKGMPLTSLESSLPLREFHVIGFTLPYELCYTNVLNMLDLADIPFRAKDRDKCVPLVVGGGACAYNPEPLAEFFDAFVLGDGEEVILEICDCIRDWKKSDADKEELYNALSKIRGVYVPSLFNVTYRNDGEIDKIIPRKADYRTVEKRIVPNLDDADYPSDFIIPFMKTVHDRLSVEITRGCTRGCRFCQAGMTYRPVRERSPEIIRKIIQKGIEKTGYEDISLLSLNTGDYSCIQGLLMDLMGTYSSRNIAVSLPSLRPETLVPELMNQIKKVRKTGITIAPEAGTQRLRDIINKGVSDEEILNTAQNVFSAGWNSMKLYFMIGLPTETEDDMKAIVELSQKIIASGKGAKSPKNVTVSISTFVPKPHTPFQWETQICLNEILEKHKFFKEQIRGRRFTLKWQEPRFSVLEGVFSRGDRRLSRVLARAHTLGCKLDAWTEHFKYELWKKAFADMEIDMDFYNRRKRSYDEGLPWDHLNCLVSKDFLIEEREKAYRGEFTPDCRKESCSGCGVCEESHINPILSVTGSHMMPVSSNDSTALNHKYRRYRLRYSKLDKAGLLSHLELVHVFSRALTRAEIPVRYSKGFHPLPKITFGTALAVGVESLAEYTDIEVETFMESHEIVDRMNRQLPKGLTILDCLEIPLNSSLISDNMRKINYLVSADGLWESLGTHEGVLRETIDTFMNKESFPVIQKKKRGIKVVDLRSIVDDLKLKDDLSIEISLTFGSAHIVKPFDTVKNILNLKEEEVKLLRILRIEERLENNPQCLLN